MCSVGIGVFETSGANWLTHSDSHVDVTATQCVLMEALGLEADDVWSCSKYEAESHIAIQSLVAMDGLPRTTCNKAAKHCLLSVPCRHVAQLAMVLAASQQGRRNELKLIIKRVGNP